MERENLPTLIKKLKEIPWNNDFEVIIVNDDNLASSIQTVKRLEKEHAEVRGLLFNERLGKTRAIRKGFEGSGGDVIVIIDADLQYSPEDIPRLFEALKYADAVTGVRVNRKDGVRRKIESKIYNFLVRLFFNVEFNDCNSGLKVFKRDVLKEVIHEMRNGWHRYLLVLADKKGYRIFEKPIRHYKRTAGKSKFASPPKLFKGFYDMLSVKVYLLRSK